MSLIRALSSNISPEPIARLARSVMARRFDDQASLLPEASSLATTHLSVALHATESGIPEAGEALELLCRWYYDPLDAFVRRQRYVPNEAEDLNREFGRFLAKDHLASLEPQKGRFHLFLLASLKYFLG